MLVNPVMLPPGRATDATKPLPTGSDAWANTIGIVRVSRQQQEGCWRAPRRTRDRVADHQFAGRRPIASTLRVYTHTDNGYWFWGRPSVVDLWRDLRAVTSEIRPDWDLRSPATSPGLGRGQLLGLPWLEQASKSSLALGWPPPGPLGLRPWAFILGFRPLSWWREVTWKCEKTDCTFSSCVRAQTHCEGYV